MSERLFNARKRMQALNAPYFSKKCILISNISRSAITPLGTSREDQGIHEGIRQQQQQTILKYLMDEYGLSYLPCLTCIRFENLEPSKKTLEELNRRRESIAALSVEVGFEEALQ